MPEEIKDDKATWLDALRENRADFMERALQSVNPEDEGYEKLSSIVRGAYEAGFVDAHRWYRREMTRPNNQAEARRI